jgi:hypothetical protein
MTIEDIHGSTFTVDEGLEKKLMKRSFLIIDKKVMVLDTKDNRYVPLVCFLHKKQSREFTKFVFKDGDFTNLQSSNVEFNPVICSNQNKGHHREYYFIGKKGEELYEIAIPYCGSVLAFWRYSLEDAISLRNSICEYIGKPHKEKVKGKIKGLSYEEKKHIYDYLIEHVTDRESMEYVKEKFKV